MRPVSRGSRPKDKQGNDIQFTVYADARGALINRMGEYCSYCEMHLDASLAVEHVQPKRPPGSATVDIARALDWDNFLLACANCNSTKDNKDVDLGEYLWPDRDNTFLALKYSEGGIVSPSPRLNDMVKSKAENIIRLTGLDKRPLNDPKASDRRWINRREAWDMAIESKKSLAKCDMPEMRELIVLLAKAKGYWSVWMTVFAGDADMLKRFIDAFPGTCHNCFDANNGYTALARPGGQC